MTTESQNKRIRAYLHGGGKLTGLKALKKFGTMCLPRRVLDIKDGVGVKSLAIKSKTIQVGKKYVAEYYWRAK